jgi:hypothetical protein
MQLLTPLLVMIRARQLVRQLTVIQRNVRALPKRSRARMSLLTIQEIGQASRGEFPHLYGTTPESRYSPWGDGTEAGYERACSDNPEVAMRGIALYLAVAYHEIRNSPHRQLQAPYRQLMQLLRELNEADNARSTVDSWMQDTGEAA